MRQKDYPLYQYLVFTDDPFPSLKRVLVRDALPGNRVFGPFKDGFHAQRIRTLAQRHFHVRVCPEAEPGNRCLRFGIGLCLGPCLKKISEAEYGLQVDRCARFLEGEDDGLTERLARDMEVRSRDLDFEGAKRIRDEAVHVARHLARQRFVRRFLEGILVIRESGKPGHTHLFVRGVPYSRKGRITDEAVARLVGKVNPERRLDGEDPRFVMDRALLVRIWLAGQGREADHRFLT